MYQDFARITTHMDVYDRSGDKVGTVGEIFAPSAVSPGTAGGTIGSSTDSMAGFVKVDTGFLGLGKDLYIPASAITDVQGDRVTLNVDKDTLDTYGWDEKPTALRDQ